MVAVVAYGRRVVISAGDSQRTRCVAEGQQRGGCVVVSRLEDDELLSVVGGQLEDFAVEPELAGRRVHPADRVGGRRVAMQPVREGGAGDRC